MAIKIALAGNPNCGKTTLFNALTGSNQFVGNWPGVTVEKKDNSKITISQYDNSIVKGDAKINKKEWVSNEIFNYKH